MSDLVWISRRDNKHDRGIADFERYESLGLVTADMLNQVGLIHREKSSPSLELAEHYLRRAASIDDASPIIRSNLALVLFERKSFSEAAAVFRQIIDSGSAIPTGYEASCLLSHRRVLSPMDFAEFLVSKADLVASLRANLSQQLGLSGIVDDEVGQLLK